MGRGEREGPLDEEFVRELRALLDRHKLPTRTNGDADAFPALEIPDNLTLTEFVAFLIDWTGTLAKHVERLRDSEGSDN